MYNVWVLGSFTTKDIFFNDFALYNSLVARGANVSSFDFQKFTIDVEGRLFYNKSIITQEPDIVIFSQPILNSDVNIIDTGFVENIDNEFNCFNNNLVIEKLKTFSNTLFYNGIEQHLTCNNKLLQYRALSSAGVNYPKTQTLITSSTEEQIQSKILEVGGYPVVLKELQSTASRGVHLCSTLEEIKTVFTKYPQNISITLLIQEYINTNGLILDLRVIGNNIYPRIVMGSPYMDQFLSNLDKQKSYVAFKTNTEIEDIVSKSMTALDIDIARFDVFITNEGLKMCEVNSIGSLLSNNQTWNKEFADEVVDFCINNYENR